MMRPFSLGVLAILVLACGLWAQPERRFDWVRASDETVQLDPMGFHAGRVYHAGPSGGNMHVLIHAAQPVSVMMVAEQDWNAAQAHPETLGRLDYRCVREHVAETTYECNVPGYPMVLVLRDERTPDHAVLEGIGAIVARAGGSRLIAPNDVRITYHNWSCVENCVQPEYQWSLIAKEKYDTAGAPKLYSVTPDYDGQRLWVKIKSQVPMTLALLPSKLADQAYANPAALSSALDQTACLQRGVQSMEFECKVIRADGPQSLLAIPVSPAGSHKKAQIEFQTLKCIANCELIPSDAPASE